MAIQSRGRIESGSDMQGSCYPFGEDRGTPLANDQVKYATYTRDSATGLDYADQRYYTSQFGRFMTPDPYRASGGPADPGSWNRYVYVGGDPINFLDRNGLEREDPEDPGPSYCDDNPTAVGCLPPTGPGPGGTKTTDDPFPNCDHGRNGRGFNPLQANNNQFLVDNYSQALAVANQYNVPVDWILGWAAFESGAPQSQGTFWGQLPQAQNGDSGFFGATGQGWIGQVGCLVPITNSQGATFACFSSFGGAANAALGSFNAKYGSILAASSSAGTSAQTAFTGVYAAGWDRPNAQPAGSTIQNIITRPYNGIDAMLDCLKQNGYIQ